MQAMREAGLLWTPTMSTFGDYLILLANVSIETNADGSYTISNNNSESVSGVTLLAESAIKSVTIDGQELTTFGGKYGEQEIVLPTLTSTQTSKLVVNLK